MLDSTSVQDATENCHYPELAGELLKLGLNITFPLGHFTELSVLGDEGFRLQLIGWMLFEKICQMNNPYLRQIFNRIPQVSLPWFFPCDYVPTLTKDTFAMMKTQPSKIQDAMEMIEIFCELLHFAHYLGRKNNSFF